MAGDPSPARLEETYPLIPLVVNANHLLCAVPIAERQVPNGWDPLGRGRTMFHVEHYGNLSTNPP